MPAVLLGAAHFLSNTRRVCSPTTSLAPEALVRDPPGVTFSLGPLCLVWTPYKILHLVVFLAVEGLGRSGRRPLPHRCIVMNVHVDEACECLWRNTIRGLMETDLEPVPHMQLRAIE